MPAYPHYFAIRTIIWTRPGDMLGHCFAFTGEEPPDGFIWSEGGPIPDQYPELRELLNKLGHSRLPDFRVHVPRASAT